jgi:predicted RNase H-like HicB family nuclease
VQRGAIQATVVGVIAEEGTVRVYSAVIERDPDTGLFIGFVPGFPGAHSQGASLDELSANLREVIAMLLEDGEPELQSEFIGVQNVAVG